MKDAESIALLICTAGERFMELSRQYNLEYDYLIAYIIDSFGSLVVEKMADYLQMQLQLEVGRRGLKITNRYSPGYCNWQLTDQKQLFELLSDNPCHILLTESMLMTPIKSISGIIGFAMLFRKINMLAVSVSIKIVCTEMSELSNLNNIVYHVLKN